MEATERIPVFVSKAMPVICGNIESVLVSVPPLTMKAGDCELIPAVVVNPLTPLLGVPPPEIVIAALTTIVINT